MKRSNGEFRIGQGFDVHAFIDGDHVMLCGIRIPHTRGLQAHSDGDVALHALCDALLGACALGDIGAHFPQDDPRFADADSRDLTRRVMALVRGQGWKINNVDITVICETPKLSQHIEAMTAVLEADLQTAAERVSIKATTTEGLGFCGRKEGIAAMAVVSLVAA